jgi:hypothetical protein
LGSALTVRKVDQVQPFIASRVLEALEPELTSSVCVSPDDGSAHCMDRQKDSICVPVEHYPLGNCDLRSIRFGEGTRPWQVLTMLSWVSLRAESFANTASSV